MALSHVKNNAPAMVDVSHKTVTRRTARAQAVIRLPEVICEAFEGGELITKKGPVFHTAIIAGTQAVKKTADLIPFCHSLPIEHCSITLTRDNDRLLILCEVSTTAKTGVEMEALTGATVAALTFYDMTKALTHDMVIEAIALLAKTGGKSDIAREPAGA